MHHRQPALPGLSRSHSWSRTHSSVEWGGRRGPAVWGRTKGRRGRRPRTRGSAPLAPRPTLAMRWECACTFLERYARELEPAGLVHQKEKLMRGQGVTETLGAHVRNAVSLRIGAAWARIPGQVDPQAVGRTESGAFANQHNR